jgi:hypothetical protein
MGSNRQIEARYADGTVELFDVDGTAGPQALLRKLVEDGRDLVEFREVGSGLEDLFMRLTQGEVQ